VSEGSTGPTGRRPNFLYIGPDKAGSSWLHEVLIRHPQVFLTEAKDLYYFDRYFDKGPEWYLGHFRGASERHAVVGEVCQDYLFHPEAPQRIAELVPDARLMVTLREPAARAWSSYLYMRKHGIDPGSFREALRSRPELLEHGRYAAHLRRYLERFDRSQLYVGVFDDLTDDPQGFLDGVLRFLHIAPMPLDDSLKESRLAAAEARSVALARLARKAAEWTREHDRAEVVGRVKRSPLLQRALYRPLKESGPKLSGADAAHVRELLAEDVSDLEELTGLSLRARWGWRTASAT
jgi:Sulfotransferase family